MTLWYKLIKAYAFYSLSTPMAKKLQLGYREIEERLQVFHDGRVPASEVGERLLFSFGKSERDIARYREGKGTLKTFTAPSYFTKCFKEEYGMVPGDVRK